ncbi:MAG: acetyl-CoA carboxylase biotin carboxyl carrier protein [Rhodospirillaceae bacterium]
MSSASIDGDAIRALAELLDETGLTDIEYEREGIRIRVGRSPAPAQMIAAPAAAPVAAAAAALAAEAAPAAPADPANHPGAVHAPMVGIVYLHPEPGAPAFVSTGDLVSEGQTLMLIEAMKTFNPVRAPKGGTVKAILVGDTAPVEFGETLLIIE